MSTFTRTIVPALAVVFALAAPAAAQKADWQGAAKLKGKVVDEEGKNVKDATVKLRHSETRSGPDMVTKGNGEFEAKNIRGGKWELEVTAKDFAMKRLTVDVPDRGDAPEQKIAIVRVMGAAHTKEMNDMLRQGDVLAQEGKYDEARKVYGKVLEGRPDAVIVNRSIAATYYREGKHGEALKYLDVVITSDPTNENLQLGAVTAAEAGDLAKMNEYLGKMSDTMMANSDMLADVAITLINKKQFAEAEKVLDRTMARFPDSAALYYYRALSKLQQQQDNKGKLADGTADLKKFVTVPGADPKQIAHAKDLLCRIDNVDCPSGVTMVNYGRLKEGMSYDEAVKLLGKAGTESASSSGVVIYMWQGEGGGNLSLTFQNGKLITKAQSGLK